MENATITLGSNDFYKRVYVRSTRRRHGKPRLPGSFAGGLPHRKCWQMLEPVALRTAMQQCVGAGQHYGIEFVSDRQSVVLGKSVSVCVDLGCRRILNKKTHEK